MNCSSIHTWLSFKSFYIGVKSYLWKTIVLLAFVITAFGSIDALARDDTIPGLERPEWQAHADLKFRNACQSALQKLCLELVQIYQRDPSLPANSDLLVDVANLLESTDGKLPKRLPDHPASIDYVKARKAAVIEWNKVYKSKGRDLPTATLEAEKNFQEAFRDPAAVLPTQMNNAAVNQPTNADSKTELDDGTIDAEPNFDDKKTDNKASEATVKNLVSLIREANKYQATNASGETTAERQASALLLKRAAYTLVEKQPDCFFTFPIKDVAARDKGLEFTVDAPIEFEQIQKSLGPEFSLSSETQKIHTKQSSILKKWKSIKPGDWLRVRFEVGVVGLNSDASGRKLSYDEQQIKFVVKVLTIQEKTTAGNGMGQNKQVYSLLQFVDKKLVELLVAKPQTKAVAP